jgi:tyrocidine synthetase-3
MRVDVSYHQERLWFIDRFERGTLYEASPTYHNIPLIMVMEGPLEREQLARGIHTVIRRHEALRTRIAADHDRPFQQIEEAYEPELVLLEAEGDSLERALAFADRPFDMDREPLFRAALIRESGQRHVLVMVFHHIIMDGCSLGIMARELAACYGAFVKGGEPQLPGVSIQYADFSQWQRQLPEAVIDTLLAYWKRRLDGKLLPLELPVDRARAAIHRFRAGRHHFSIGETLCAQIDRFCQRQGCDHGVLLLAAFKTLLFKYCGSGEIVVGTVGANRDQLGTGQVVGPVANLLVLRSRISGVTRFGELIRQLDQGVREALKFQALPFDRLVQELNPDKDMSRTALFDVLFRCEGEPFRVPGVENLSIEIVETNLGWGKYDLNLLIQRRGDRFSGILVYNREYYDAATIERFGRHYRVLLEHVVAAADRQIAKIPILSPEEHRQLLEEWNRTPAGYPRDRCLHQIFAAQVERHVHCAAVVYGELSLSYGLLDRRVNGLALRLRERHGLQPHQLVGIMVKRSEAMIGGLLAMLKGGGAYVPIDPSYPPERIHYMLSDSGCRLLLKEEDLNQPLDPAYDGEVVDMAAAWQEAGEGAGANVGNVNRPVDAAYVIYTSGTTGYPKGCIVSHGNVVQLLKNDRHPFDFHEGDVWIMAHSFCFDFSVWEMYGALLYGGKLVVAAWPDVQDVCRFVDLLYRHHVTVLNQTPGAFYNLMEEEKGREPKTLNRHLRWVCFGGDTLEPSRLGEWLDMYSPSEIRLVNMYGITETTVHVTYYPLSKEDLAADRQQSPIGLPLPGTTLYIYDEGMNPLPPGVKGELVVGGSGVSRGYLNRPGLTRERFIENPHVRGEVIYRSGDLGKRLASGPVVYLGRLDKQVKIRGYRIELAEIEHRLLSHHTIKEAVVVARDDRDGSKYLCAYIVPTPTNQTSRTSRTNPTQLRQYLSRTLPSYMIPAYFVQLPQIPLTPNRKIDREALPEPTVATTGQPTPPISSEERALVNIWAEVLGIRPESIGVEADFFDLGGHSLKLTILAAKIHKALAVKLPLAAIFEHATLKDLAAHIREVGREEFVAIVPLEKREYYGVSPAQKRLFILCQMAETATNYNIPFFIFLEGEAARERLQRRFKRLIDRHDSLRTSFVMKAERLVQRVHDEVDFDIECYDSGAPGEILKNFVRPFDLSKAPLLRVGLAAGHPSQEGMYILMVDMHHIITDGISQQILMEEFQSLETASSLPPLRLQYKDYAGWQNSEIVRERIEAQQSFWLKTFAADIPVLDLPLDFPRPEVQRFEGEHIGFSLGADESASLWSLALHHDVTLFMLLLALFNVLLSKLGGGEDMVVGTPVAGRRHADLEGIVGMFVNTLALRSQPVAEKRFTEFLAEVKRRTLEAFENQDYPFEDLVEKAAVRRDAGRNPLFDVMLVLQNQGERRIDAFDAAAAEQFDIYARAYRVSKFDLTLMAVEGRERLHFNVEYSTNLFKEETVRRFIAYFRQVVSAVSVQPGVQLAAIEIIDARERQQLLVAFNDTAADYPAGQTIHRLFINQADKRPDRLALMGDKTQLSYDCLKKSALHLAHRLRDEGVIPDTIAALMVERSPEMVTAILAVLMAGGAYLPLDPAYPEERIRFMLRDSGAGFLLTTHHREREYLENISLIPVSPAALPLTPPSRGLPVEQGKLAYVIYTSGSTGRPKGVAVEHGSVVNFITAVAAEIEFRAGKTIINVTTIAFDIFLLETLLPLSRGMKVVIAAEAVQADPLLLKREIIRHAVDMLQLTPSRLQLWPVGELSSVLRGIRQLMVGGEALPKNVFNRLRREYNGSIYNLYGPTETTVWSTLKDLTRMKAVTIGKPLANTVIHIVDHSGALQPMGVAGELCIGGDGLARGYLNNPDLTAKKFINVAAKGREDTRSSVHQPLNPKSQILYRTGDLCRFLPGGDIEFMGRLDHQVKIRGFRIEPEEIRHHLLSHPFVKEAVVVAQQDPNGDPYLTAYFVLLPTNQTNQTNRTNETSPAQLRQYLSRTLPDYMIPAHFVQLPQIPLTPNGKIDRQALPQPTLESGSSPSPCRDALEEKLADMWSGVLGIESSRIGIDTNFFEIGGHSLKAAILVSRVRREFEVAFTLSHVFSGPTIRQFSCFIREAGKRVTEAIEPVERRQYYDLSPGQRRLFLLAQLDIEGTGYNMPTFFEIDGGVDIERQKRLFNALVSRHESLRTSFTVIGERPVQRVHEEVDIEIRRYDLRDPAAALEEFIRPFDLSKPPLLRLGLAAPREGMYVLMVDMHHIVSDGISQQVLMEEYRSLSAGESLPPLKLQYRDYANWQNSRQQEESIKAQERYWLAAFAGDIPVLDLPLDYPRPAVQRFEGGHIGFVLADGQTAALRGLALEHDVTLFMLLLALFNVLLSKLGGGEDIVVGTPTAGRRHADLERIIGMFVNTLALRNFPVGEKDFATFLTEVRRRSLEAFENQEYPFEDLVEKAAVSRDTGRNPLFDVMLVLQNQGEPRLGGFDMTAGVSGWYEAAYRTAKFDLSLYAVEAGDRLHGNCEYSSHLFKRETAARFIVYFKRLVSSVLAAPAVRLKEIDLMDSGERQRLLVTFNDTEAAYPVEQTITGLFIDQAEKRPDRLALTGDRGQLSCRRLKESALQLARQLRKEGTGADVVVAVMVERSLDMVAAVLAILVSGGAYLPLDPDYPRERRQFMLEDSGARTLLDDHSLNRLNRSGSESHTFPQPAQLKPTSLAYVIYTSGSTGRPKGVMVAHRSVVNLLAGLNRAYPVDASSVYLLKTPYVFDVSVAELFGWFVGGGRLAILCPGAEKDPRQIVAAVERGGVSHINFVPAMFRSFLEVLNPREVRRLAGLRYIFLAGEALPPDLVEAFKQYHSGILLENLYGPTEATVYASRFSLGEWRGGAVAIGSPLANMKLFILDRHERLCVPGVAGELYISGLGVARGYLNNPELTADKFVNVAAKGREDTRSPIHQILTPKSQPLYRTGDLARFLPDGTVEFLGRLDQQVKIRGFRIEPEEIRHHLLSHPFVKEAVIMARDNRDGGKYLCAYIVSADGSAVESSELRTHLGRYLPSYMIPSHFVPLPRVPLTAAGKIDQRALPEPKVERDEAYVGPADEVETAMAAIWSDLLNIDRQKIGVDDNFFHLGGHSLKATIMTGRVHRAFEVKLPLARVFKTPSIRGLCRYIKSAMKDRYTPIRPVEKREYYALSSAQKRLYILQQMEEVGTAYNMPQVFVLQAEVDRRQLEGIFQSLIRRHQSLRTSFHRVREQPVQKIHDSAAFHIECCDLPLDRFVRPFNLETPPLLRVALASKQEGKSLLMVDTHHIVSDGISQQVLMEEYVSLASGSALPPSRLQYKDYANWQNSERTRQRIKRQESYWLKVFEGEIPVLNLPTDFLRPTIQSFAGGSLSFEIEAEETGALRRLCRDEGVTLYMVLLALFNVLLSKLSGSEDIVVGTPVAGRRHPDLEKIMGMFVNTLALRNRPVGERRFTGFLQEVGARALAGFENQDYPFEDLVEQLAVKRDTGRNPLFDVLFVLQNIEPISPGSRPAGWQLYPDQYENRVSKFDITLIGVEGQEKLFFNVQYCSRLFKPQRLEGFIRCFKQILRAAVREPALKLARIEMVSTEERQQLLYDFNDTQTDYPRQQTIHGLFQERQAASGGAAAVVFEDQFLTYRALNERADRLAHYLGERGFKPAAIAAIMADYSPETVIGLIAVLKAGGAYLPVNADYPERRQRYLLRESRVSVVLTDGEPSAWIDREDETVPPIHLKRWALEDQGAARPFSAGRAGPDDLAYIMYTSGSTGEPKGVMVAHRSVVRLVRSTDYLSFKAGDRLLPTGALEFDASTFEIWGALLNGLTLCLMETQRLLEPGELKGRVRRYDIGTLWLTSPLFNQLLDADIEIFSGLRNLLVGGDVLSAVHINRLRSRYPGLNVINGYGPTENTTFSTTHPIRQAYRDRIPIGRPIANSTAYILDKHMGLRPVGIPGELWVGGDGLARGYLNNPDLTADRFINVAAKGREDTRSYNYYILTPKSQILYRTGDLCRFLADGSIEFLDRIDQQVKIRGFRVELAETEHHLLRHPEIDEAVVTVRGRGDDKHLTAYIVLPPPSRTNRTSQTSITNQTNRTSPAKFRSHLAGILPDYMIPTHFVQLPQIPLTPNGKIDRRALPEPEISGRYTLPRGETETRLAAIWSEVLNVKVEKIGADDNFFELGGHSLKAMVMAGRVERAFNVKLPLAEIFRTPSIRELARFIRGAEPVEFEDLQHSEEKEYYPLSHKQRRLWVINQMAPTSTAYNISGRVLFRQPLKEEIVRQVLERMAGRHESLRTGFKMVGDEPVQWVAPEAKVPLEVVDMSSMEEAAKQRQDAFDRLRQSPIPLTDCPLFRVLLLKLDEAEWEVAFNMHHIVSDGWSMEILGNEFSRLYESYRSGDEVELVPLRFQYRDFCRWQNRRLSRTGLKEEAHRFWKERFQPGLPVLKLPQDFRGSRSQRRSAAYRFVVPQPSSGTLKRLAGEYRTSLFTVLFAAFNVMLHHLTGQADIVCGIVSAGRDHVALQHMVGYFINALIFRCRLDRGEGFEQFLVRLNRELQEAFKYQDYPPELVFDDLNMRFPDIQVAFNMLNMQADTAAVELPDRESRHVDNGGEARFDLELYAAEYGSGIQFECLYRQALYRPATIEYIMGAYLKILHHIGTAVLTEESDHETSQPQN